MAESSKIEERMRYYRDFKRLSEERGDSLPTETKVDRAWSVGTHPRKPIMWGSCFDEAFRYVIWHRDIQGMRFVLGSTRDAIYHGWLELPGGVVFDGVWQRFYERESYYSVLRADVIKDMAAAELVDRRFEMYGTGRCNWARVILGSGPEAEAMSPSG